ncbi:hypothetical protein BDV28DRAFT_133284 [Aspergillus coremiiformis]|uniref:Uncharacterized protein n=1 Tax=Aspergillus coremiiformis TaxID=138285 RepID=A0A5N6Z7D3_9EURO|nr:hypothetical protein BDV28DRAFT_133284 [Aspergillus coremiiformis]
MKFHLLLLSLPSFLPSFFLLFSFPMLYSKWKFIPKRRILCDITGTKGTPIDTIWI